MRIVVVGAGVAGCIMVRALARLPGADVLCLERAECDDQSEQGTGLNIGPNGVQALRMHDPTLALAITAASLPWRRWKVSLTDGTLLFDLALATVANNDGWRIRWSELYRILRKAAAPHIAYRTTITWIGPCKTDSTKAALEWIEAGSRKSLDEIDLLIGADGRYSQVRQATSGAAAVRQVGVAMSRALVPDTSGGLIDDYEQWFNGPNRLLAFRVPSAHIYATCAFPIPIGEEIPEHLKRREALRSMYVPPSGKLSPPVGWLVEAICSHAADLHWARMQEHDLFYADPYRNVLFLGDAAHAMVPTLGQGATQAIEDATLAADVIAREWACGRCEPRGWLQLISNLRSDRMRFAMQVSLEASDTLLAGADPVAGTLQKTKSDFLAKLHRLYCGAAEISSASAVAVGVASARQRRLA
jgi:2-polyprenyl-6-methoxyphenol hydroxylase-like FAD-dependent oxidoreductase